VKPFCMHDRGKFGSQSKIQSGSAFLKGISWAVILPAESYVGLPHTILQ
jgi:hypothetical protein